MAGRELPAMMAESARSEDCRLSSTTSGYRVAVGTLVAQRPRTDPDMVVKPSGSYLGCLTANRTLGHGCRTRGVGQYRSTSAASRCQLKRSRCDRRRSTFIHVRVKARIKFRRKTEAGRDGEVVQPSIDDPPQPLRDLMEVVVHAPPQSFRDTLQSAPHPLRNGLAPDPELPASGLPTVVRESQEAERLRATQPSRPTVRLGVPSELNEPCLVRVQGQIKLAEPFPERMQKAFRVLLVLEPDDHIIA